MTVRAKDCVTASCRSFQSSTTPRPALVRPTTSIYSTGFSSSSRRTGVDSVSSGLAGLCTFHRPVLHIRKAHDTFGSSGLGILIYQWAAPPATPVRTSPTNGGCPVSWGRGGEAPERHSVGETVQASLGRRTPHQPVPARCLSRGEGRDGPEHLASAQP